MKLFMVHVGYYDKSIGEGLYETHLNYFVAAEDAKDAKNKAHQLSESQERSMHIDGMKEQLKRQPYKLPKLIIQKKPFWELTFNDFSLIDYKHHPIIKFPVAI